jgi:hypothetical protein
MNFATLKSYIKKYPVGTGAVIIAVVMLGAFVFRYMEYSEMQSSFATTVAEGQRLAANVSHAAQLEEQLHSLEAANTAITERLVNPSDLAINLQYFYKLESDTGVKLLDTHPVDTRAGGKASPKGTYTPVQYAVSLQGSYARTLVFLRKLEHGVFFSRVISASCGQSQTEQDKGGGDTVISLTVELLGRS